LIYEINMPIYVFGGLNILYLGKSHLTLPENRTTAYHKVVEREITMNAKSGLIEQNELLELTDTELENVFGGRGNWWPSSTYYTRIATGSLTQSANNSTGTYGSNNNTTTSGGGGNTFGSSIPTNQGNTGYQGQ
jgi:hypothetical protein